MRLTEGTRVRIVDEIDGDAQYYVDRVGTVVKVTTGHYSVQLDKDPSSIWGNTIPIMFADDDVMPYHGCSECVSGFRADRFIDEGHGFAGPVAAHRCEASFLDEVTLPCGYHICPNHPVQPVGWDALA